MGWMNPPRPDRRYDYQPPKSRRGVPLKSHRPDCKLCGKRYHARDLCKSCYKSAWKRSRKWYAVADDVIVLDSRSDN